MHVVYEKPLVGGQARRGNLRTFVTNLNQVNTWLANQRYNDCIKLQFGTCQDASLFYNQTDLVLKPNDVGCGVVKICGNLSVVGGQIKFPATESASADANTFDDYQEGVFTPVLVFDVLGDLCVVYSTQKGHFTKKGREVTVSYSIITSTFTHTTATGNLRVTGLPFTAANVTGQLSVGAVFWAGFTKSNYTHLQGAIAPNDSRVSIFISGSGQASDNADVADMPTGGTVRMQGTIIYNI